jgi:hypothetical protein
MPPFLWPPLLRSTQILPVGQVAPVASRMVCAAFRSPDRISSVTSFIAAHISGRPLTLVSKKASRCLASSDGVHGVRASWGGECFTVGAARKGWLGRSTSSVGEFAELEREGAPRAVVDEGSVVAWRTAFWLSSVAAAGDSRDKPQPFTTVSLLAVHRKKERGRIPLCFSRSHSLSQQTLWCATLPLLNEDRIVRKSMNVVTDIGRKMLSRR